jgi:DNA helicase IV
MVTILDRLVKSYQSLPESDVSITVDNIELTVTEAIVKRARTRARRSRRPHNAASPLFKESLVEQLSFQLADIIGKDPLGGNLLSAADVAQLHDDLLQEPQIDDLVDEFWPALDPVSILQEFLTSKEAIANIAYDYDEETQSALLRTNTTGFASSDAALLDELAQLVGLPDPEEEREAERKRWREQLEEAQDALDVLSSS